VTYSSTTSPQYHPNDAPTPIYYNSESLPVQAVLRVGTGRNECKSTEEHRGYAPVEYHLPLCPAKHDDHRTIALSMRGRNDMEYSKTAHESKQYRKEWFECHEENKDNHTL
jgi:hypothetical protein